MFAEIRHIDDIRDIVEAEEEFYLNDKGDYVVANYKSIMATFENPLAHNISNTERQRRLVLRECRGMLFDSKTGDIVRRPLHKFLNLGQGAGNDFRDHDWSSFEVYDKLDGSMIAPFECSDGRLRWGSKAGETHMTPDVEAFVARNPQYFDFVNELTWWYTPIFEYQAPKHRIVVEVPRESMTLLAIRHMHTGEYLTYGAMVNTARDYGIPVVRRWEIDSEATLVDTVRELRNAEGVVARFHNDERVKIKSLWYVDLHKNRDAVARERYVAMMALTDKVDDLLPLVPEHVQKNMSEYTAAILRAFEARAQEFADELSMPVLRYWQATGEPEVDNGMFDNAKVAAQAAERQARKEFAMDGSMSDLAKRMGFKIINQTLPEDASFLQVVSEQLREHIVNICDQTETRFESEIRNKLFRGQLPEWNIWLEDGEA